MNKSDDHLSKFKDNLAFYFSEKLDYPFAKPYWIYISVSHKCTYKCQMCGVVNILKDQELSTQTVKKTLDEIASWGKDCVILFTGGEVFLRKDFFELIEYSAGKGLKAEAVSNGSLIDEEMAHRIICSGLQNIAVSLDGARQVTHDAIRQKGAYQKALSALRYLVAAKKKAGSGPQISTWTTIMKENLDELYDVIPLVKDIGVECLVFHPVIVAQDDMQNTCADAPFWISKETLPILRKQIDKITDYQRKHGLVAFLHDPYLWLNYFEGTLKKQQWKCNPFVFLNIGPDGEVRSCGASFGNIKESSLNDCLQNSEADKARRFMKACEKPCLQTCWAHPESDSLAAIVENFIREIKPDISGRSALLNEAMQELQEYEQKLKNYIP